MGRPYKKSNTTTRGGGGDRSSRMQPLLNTSPMVYYDILHSKHPAFSPLMAMDSPSSSPHRPSISTPPPPPRSRWRPSPHNPCQKRMSATLAEQLDDHHNFTIINNHSTTIDDPALHHHHQQQTVMPISVQKHLARLWAYSLGAELAHHVVGVFKDPSNPNYRRRWDSELACKVFGSNPWHALPKQEYFHPPFGYSQIMANVPKCMQTVPRALNTVSNIVSTRNEMQHIPFPEDVYMLIRVFKDEKLMKHITEDKELHDFLNSDKFLADWFIGTPRIHRLTGQLLFNARSYLCMDESANWVDSLKYKVVREFLANMLSNITSCDKMEWYKQKWPQTVLELAEDLDEIELTDEGFGPRMEKRWRDIDDIFKAYELCNASGLLTPSVRRFCSLPCVLLDNAHNLFIDYQA